MRCQNCLLESPAVSELPLPELAARLGSCDECPLRRGTSACPASVVAALCGRLQETAVEARRQANKLRRAEHTLLELQQEIQRSDERVAKLEALHAQSAREADAELRKKIEQIERQQAAILALSTPVIQVWEGVLVLPLIGIMDEQRVTQLTTHLLDEIKERRAPHAILDLTGIMELDQISARHLMRVIDAVALLGAEAMLCGLRPEVAQVLSGLDVDMQTVRVARSLNEALIEHVRHERRRPSGT